MPEEIKICLCAWCGLFYRSGHAPLDPQPLCVPEPYSHGACAICFEREMAALENVNLDLRAA